MSKKDGKLLHNIFFNKQSFRRSEIPCGYCVCLLLSPCRTEVQILSINQRTTCVAQTCQAVPGTLSGVSVPQRRSTTRRVQLSVAQSGSRPRFGSVNATRTAPMRTEPSRTLRWKCANRERVVTSLFITPLFPSLINTREIEREALAKLNIGIFYLCM